MPLRKTTSIKYFSICSECQREYDAGTTGRAKPSGLVELSSNSADIKYDIIAHAQDELSSVAGTGVELTQDDIARTWRAKVMNECGQDSGCAKLLLLQVGLNLVETGAIRFEWVATRLCDRNWAQEEHLGASVLHVDCVGVLEE